MPPFWVYFLAVNRGITPEAMALKSGLSLRTVQRVWPRITWAGIKLGIMEKFCLACDITPWKYNQRDYEFLYMIKYRRVKVPFSNLSSRQRKALDLCCRRFAAVQPIKASV